MLRCWRTTLLLNTNYPKASSSPSRTHAAAPTACYKYFTNGPDISIPASHPPGPPSLLQRPISHSPPSPQLSRLGPFPPPPSPRTRSPPRPPLHVARTRAYIRYASCPLQTPPRGPRVWLAELELMDLGFGLR
jgi:hypothetical protein